MTESWKNLEEPLAVLRGAPRGLHTMSYLQSRLYSCIIMPWDFKTVHTVCVRVPMMSQSRACYICNCCKENFQLISGGIFHLDWDFSVSQITLPRCFALVSEITHKISRRKATLLTIYQVGNWVTYCVTCRRFLSKTGSFRNSALLNLI